MRNRHTGRINAAKLAVLVHGKSITTSDGKRYARLFIVPKGATEGYFVGPQVRVPRGWGEK